MGVREGGGVGNEVMRMDLNDVNVKIYEYIKSNESLYQYLKRSTRLDSPRVHHVCCYLN